MRNIALFLALILCVSAFVSCNADEPADTTAAETTGNVNDADGAEELRFENILTLDDYKKFEESVSKTKNKKELTAYVGDAALDIFYTNGGFALRSASYGGHTKTFDEPMLLSGGACYSFAFAEDAFVIREMSHLTDDISGEVIFANFGNAWIIKGGVYDFEYSLNEDTHKYFINIDAEGNILYEKYPTKYIPDQMLCSELYSCMGREEICKEVGEIDIRDEALLMKNKLVYTADEVYDLEAMFEVWKENDIFHSYELPEFETLDEMLEYNRKKSGNDVHGFKTVSFVTDEKITTIEWKDKLAEDRFKVSLRVPDVWISESGDDENAGVLLRYDEGTHMELRAFSSYAAFNVDPDFILDGSMHGKVDPNGDPDRQYENTAVTGETENGYEYVMYKTVDGESFIADVYLRIDDEYIIRFILWDLTEKYGVAQTVLDSVTVEKYE